MMSQGKIGHHLKRARLSRLDDGRALTLATRKAYESGSGAVSDGQKLFAESREVERQKLDRQQQWRMQKIAVAKQQAVPPHG